MNQQSETGVFNDFPAITTAEFWTNKKTPFSDEMRCFLILTRQCYSTLETHKINPQTWCVYGMPQKTHQKKTQKYTT